MRWTAACGLGLNDMAFDPSLLAYFRRRLSRSAGPNRVFEAVREMVKAIGVLKGKHRRASTDARSEPTAPSSGAGRPEESRSHGWTPPAQRARPSFRPAARHGRCR
ncbi:hypothetical protein [Streptomyces sp. NPDC002758]